MMRVVRLLARSRRLGVSCLVLVVWAAPGLGRQPASSGMPVPPAVSPVGIPPVAPAPAVSIPPVPPALVPSVMPVSAAEPSPPAASPPGLVPAAVAPASASPPAPQAAGIPPPPSTTPPGAVIPVATAPPFGGPGQPFLPPPPTAPGSAELRLQALEQQNALLIQQLAELNQRQQSLATRVSQIPPQEASLNYITPGQFGRPRQPGADIIETEGEEQPRARVDLTQGVRFLSPDGKYRIEFHDLTQGEFRGFANTSPSSAGQTGLHDNFDIPRQRLYFTGQVDRYFDFYTVYNRGYGSFDLLDSFVNFKFDTTFNVRVGRTKTPYTYEYYKVAEGDLIAPERSVFVGNLAPNRQVGLMTYGRFLGESIEYAAGVFNGPHNSVQDFNNYKNPFLFINTRPFLYGGSDFLRHMNFGGSVNFGRQNDPLEPNALHTANDETITGAISNISPTFLQFNPLAVELGRTAFWSGDFAWYYRSLTALAMYNGGFITYALPGKSGIQVPFEGGSVAVTYFLTGEEIVTRKEVEPLRDFDFHDPLNHPGAFELYTRAAYVNAGQIATSSGLVDPKMWSRNATVLDNGVNWYMNRFVRIFLDWQHAEFGSPVSLGGGRFTKSTDMFWFRTQLYY